MLSSLIFFAACAFAAPVPEPLPLSVGQGLLGAAAVIGPSVAISEGIKKERLRDRLVFEQVQNQEVQNQQNAIIAQQKLQIDSLSQVNQGLPIQESVIAEQQAIQQPVIARQQVFQQQTLASPVLASIPASIPYYNAPARGAYY